MLKDVAAVFRILLVGYLFGVNAILVESMDTRTHLHAHARTHAHRLLRLQVQGQSPCMCVMDPLAFFTCTHTHIS